MIDPTVTLPALDLQGKTSQPNNFPDLEISRKVKCGINNKVIKHSSEDKTRLASPKVVLRTGKFFIRLFECHYVETTAK